MHEDGRVTRNRRRSRFVKNSTRGEVRVSIGADSASVTQHGPKLNFGKMASSWSHVIIRGSTCLQRQFRDGVGATQVHDLVFAVTANELAQENKYKELLRGPDHQERTINSNYNRWNPCVTAEVSVDVTNDGKHWRGLGVFRGAFTSLLGLVSIRRGRGWFLFRV